MNRNELMKIAVVLSDNCTNKTHCKYCYLRTSELCHGKPVVLCYMPLEEIVDRLEVILNDD